MPLSPPPSRICPVGPSGLTWCGWEPSSLPCLVFRDWLGADLGPLFLFRPPLCDASPSWRRQLLTPLCVSERRRRSGLCLSPEGVRSRRLCVGLSACVVSGALDVPLGLTLVPFADSRRALLVDLPGMRSCGIRSSLALGNNVASEMLRFVKPLRAKAVVENLSLSAGWLSCGRTRQRLALRRVGGSTHGF
jgi:hypothetical protein